MENLKNIIGKIVVLVVIIICLYLVIIGQKTIGYLGLGKMVIGLLGILILLYLYNRKYR